MTKNRLEAFSDGVIAILITIMVLELKVPHGSDMEALRSLWPVFLSYVLSFLYLGIYWNNHHHLLHATSRISGSVLWSNLHLLFWLSLFPFATHWMGENHFDTLPAAAYGIVLLLAAIAYFILENTILRAEGPDSKLRVLLGRDVKGKASIVLYAIGVGLSFVSTWLALTVYAGVALMWLVPDSRIERRL